MSASEGANDSSRGNGLGHGPVRSLAAFLPSMLLDQLRDDDGKSSARPTSGAALFLDITGFSELTEQFAEEGIEGVERLTDLLDAYFGPLIRQVYRFGGDVVDFSGDAILAFWPAGEHTLEHQALAAAECATAMVAEFDGYQMEEYGVNVRMKIGLGIGDGAAIIVGKPGQERKFALVGEPCAEVGSTTDAAQPGDIVLSGRYLPLIEPFADTEPMPDNLFRLLRLNGSFAQLTDAPRLGAGYSEASVRDFLVPAVLQPFDAGQENWIAEFRTLSVLFVNIESLNCAEESGLELFRQVAESVLDIVAPLEGIVVQILQDDKGVVIEIAFGLPLYSHEDDALRAVIAGLKIQDAVAALSIPFGLGLTTGAVFCGSYGSVDRRHYAAVGKSVNLAARLMQKADRQLLCDRTTFLRAGGARHGQRRPVGFSALQPIHLKGQSQAVEVYVPFQSASTADLNRALPAEQRGFVGREEELQLLESFLESIRTGESKAFILSGEAGIGKSMLVGEAVWRASNMGTSHLIAAADSVENSTPYYALREMFQQLLGITQEETFDSLTGRLEEILGDSIHLAPLLNAVVPVDLEETNATRQMTGEVRADATRRLLLDLVARYASSQPLLVVVEDLHWLDSVSWEFTKALIGMRARMGVLITTRPMTDEAPAGFDVFAAQTNVQLLNVPGLSIGQIGRLAAGVLGVTSVSPELQRLLFERSEGHPLFARELVYALHEAGVVRVKNREAQVVYRATEDGAPFPDTLHGIITSRLDRLAPDRSLTLKVGSVIGRTFLVSLLEAVRPPQESDEPVVLHLKDMTSENLLMPEGGDAELRYSFTHVLIREVLYNQIPYAQRRDYHARTARHIEARFGGKERHQFAQLAHHWQAAGDVARCVRYLDECSAQALIDGANKECIAFAQRALALADETDTAVWQRAAWEQRISEAHYGEGNIELSDVHVRRSLALLSEEIPDSRSQWRQRALREMIVQLGHLVRRGNRVVSAPEQKRLRVAARAYGVVGEQGYFKSDALMWFAMSLAAINCAEDAQERESAGRSYGGMGYAMGAARLSWLARRFFTEANRHQNARSWGISYCGEGNWHVAFGRWDRAYAVMERGIERSRAAGDRFTLGFAYAIFGQAYNFPGHLEQAAAIFQRQREAAYQDDNRLYLSWALCDLADNRFAAGRLDEAAALLEEAEPVVQGVDSYSQLRRYGVDAIVRLERGELETARASAISALETARDTPLFQSSFFWMLYGTSQTLVQLYGRARARGEPDEGDLLRLAEEACELFRSLSRMFPIMRSRYLQTQALLFSFQGAPGKARRLARKAIRLAEKYDMPLDAGLSHALCARLEQLQDRAGPKVQRHLELAVNHLETVNATWHLDRVLKFGG